MGVRRLRLLARRSSADVSRYSRLEQRFNLPVGVLLPSLQVLALRSDLQRLHHFLIHLHTLVPSSAGGQTLVCRLTSSPTPVDYLLNLSGVCIVVSSMEPKDFHASAAVDHPHHCPHRYRIHRRQRYPLDSGPRSNRLCVSRLVTRCVSGRKEEGR